MPLRVGVPLVLHCIHLERIARVSLGFLALCLVRAPCASFASADHVYPRAPGAAGRAPIGVMMAHTHDRGEWMISYRYVRGRRKGNRDGTRSLTLGQVLEDFDVAPRELELQEHILSAMYSPHKRVTLAVVLPFLARDMENIRENGSSYSSYQTHSRGLGDVEVLGLLRFMQKDTEALHVQLGLTIPTGSVSLEDDVGGAKTPLPYCMQLGTGSVGLLPGFTYLGYYEDLSWGVQVTGAIQMGRNHKDYRWGNRWQTGGWLVYSWVEWISTSLRLSFDSWDDVRGEDTALRVLASRGLASPAADPGRLGGRRLDLGPGVNFKLPGLGDKRLAVEMLWPIYQSLHGPQLETTWTLALGVQLGF